LGAPSRTAIVIYLCPRTWMSAGVGDGLQSKKANRKKRGRICNALDWLARERERERESILWSIGLGLEGIRAHPLFP